MNFRKLSAFLISCIALLLGNVIYTLCCGPTPDPYDYYISFFSPVTKGAGYEPFYYTSLDIFYAGATPTESEANTIDWQKQTGNKVTAKDIRSCIYSYSVNNFEVINSGTNLPDSLSQNTFVRYLLKNKEAARYLLFAKNCEPYVYEDNSWSAPTVNILQLKKLYDEGINLYHQTKDEKVRDRYAFQLIRLLHYSKQYQKASISFDQFFKKENPSLIYYKSLALKAGALFHLKDTVQSAYIFSRVFEKAPSLRENCFISYKWCNVTPAMVYTQCRSNQEKAVVAGLEGFGDPVPGTAVIRNTYQLDPSASILNVLLAREINKLEDTYLAPKMAKEYKDVEIRTLDYGDVANQPKLRQDVVALQQMADSFIAERKLKDINYWRITAAYLCYMNQDYAGAKSRLAAVKTKDAEEKDQWEVVNLLVNINQQKQIDKNLEEELLASFKWLDKKVAGTEELNWDNYLKQPGFYRRIYRNLLFAVIAPKYHAQGNQAKEALIRGRCDSLKVGNYFVSGISAADQIQDEMGPAELIRLHDFLQQEKKTPYEVYLSGFFPKELEINREIGTSYLRMQDFKSAAEWYKKAPESCLVGSYQVFNEQLTDYGEDTQRGKFNKPINQLAFANEMVALEDAMKNPKVPATTYFKYANALFSISYYGHSWQLVKNYRPTYLWYEAKYDRDVFTKQYFGCYKAEEYYLKALKASAPANKEFRARCAFLAARSAQKHISIAEDNYIKNWINNKYFPQLVKEYSQTKFYNQVYSQCGYLREYVKPTKK